MQTLIDWAARHSIPPHVLADLLAVMGAGQPDGPPPPPAAGSRPASEASIQSAVRLAAARRGVLLWRNNIGATQDERGNYLRYGLANDSPQINKVLKSSDLIGIGPDGKFWAVECKSANWRYRETDDRARAQFAFIRLIISRGGVAKFITNPEEL